MDLLFNLTCSLFKEISSTIPGTLKKASSCSCLWLLCGFFLPHFSTPFPYPFNPLKLGRKKKRTHRGKERSLHKIRGQKVGDIILEYFLLIRVPWGQVWFFFSGYPSSGFLLVVSSLCATTNQTMMYSN